MLLKSLIKIKIEIESRLLCIDLIAYHCTILYTGLPTKNETVMTTQIFFDLIINWITNKKELENQSFWQRLNSILDYKIHIILKIQNQNFH